MKSVLSRLLKRVLMLRYRFLVLILLLPSSVFAFSGFESRLQGLQNSLIGVLLPLFSVIGLVYAVFLALWGEDAKARILKVVVCSAIGFLAPYIIDFIKMSLGF